MLRTPQRKELSELGFPYRYLVAFCEVVAPNVDHLQAVTEATTASAKSETRCEGLASSLKKVGMHGWRPRAPDSPRLRVHFFLAFHLCADTVCSAAGGGTNTSSAEGYGGSSA